MKETMDDHEDKQQTLRLCSETDDVTIAMLKMNTISSPLRLCTTGSPHNSLNGQKRLKPT
eukprot:2340233-Amphidinium_carterae.1